MEGRNKDIKQERLEQILEIPMRVKAHIVQWSDNSLETALEIPPHYEGKILPEMISTPGFSGVENTLEHLRDNFEKSIKSNLYAFTLGPEEVHVKWISGDEEYVYRKVCDVTKVESPFSNPVTRRLLDYVLIKHSGKDWRIDYGEGDFGKNPAQRFIKFPEI